MSGESDDLREFYYSAPAGAVAFETFEFRHPAFLQNGVVTPVRIVNDPDDLIATLEADAPADAGQAVTFQGCQFEAQLVESTDQGIPQGTLAIDNVSALLMPYLAAGAGDPNPIELTYRQFLADDLSAPAQIVAGIAVLDATGDEQRVTATIGFANDMNKPFPRISYTTTEFPGLAR